MAESEAQLLARYARHRDPEAFRELMARHEGMVFAVCRRVLGDAHEAEDAAQNCFLALARKASRLRAPLGGWLHNLAVDTSIDVLRAKGARRAREAKAAERAAHERDATWDDISDAVDEAIAALPRRLRTPIVLHYLEGRTQQEVARELGVTQSAVSKRLRSGEELLRRRLRRAGAVLSVAVLAFLLTSNATEAAPAALTAALGKMALAGAAGKQIAAAAGAAAGGVTMLKVGMIAAGAAAVATTVAVVVKEDPKPAAPQRQPVVAQTVAAPQPEAVCAQGVSLADIRNWRKPGQLPFWAMRISPDGEHVLYSQPVREQDGTYVPDKAGQRAALFLRSLQDGSTRMLPDALYDDNWRTMHTRFSCFDPSGKRLVCAVPPTPMGELMATIRYNMNRELGNKRRFEVGWAEDVFYRFDPRGEALIGTSRDQQWDLLRITFDGDDIAHSRPMGVKGFLSSVCPTADVLCLLRQAQGRRLILWDMAESKEIADFPIHPRNSKLNEWETQWTADGRYLAYPDLMRELVDPDGLKLEGRLAPVTRICDRERGQECATFQRHTPIGPGPTPSSLYLARRHPEADQRILVFDMASRTPSYLGGPYMRLIHGWGDKVVYVEQLPGKEERVHVRRVVLLAGKLRLVPITAQASITPRPHIELLDAEIRQDLERARSNFSEPSKALVLQVWQDFQTAFWENGMSRDFNSWTVPRKPDVADYDEYLGVYSKGDEGERDRWCVTTDAEGRFLVLLEGRVFPAVAWSRSLFFLTGDVCWSRLPTFGPPPPRGHAHASLEMFVLTRVDGQYHLCCGREWPGRVLEQLP